MNGTQRPSTASPTRGSAPSPGRPAIRINSPFPAARTGWLPSTHRARSWTLLPTASVTWGYCHDGTQKAREATSLEDLLLSLVA